ncbi:MAG TPA: PAS domain-containing protein [Candidatus Binatia bacterium]|nr:PAS domain-containing protein [Candidatus Binatia bacterium]
MQRTAELAAANEELHEARSALQKALAEVQKSEAKLRQVIDAIPTLAWCNLPDGPNEFLNKGWHEYTGFSPEESHGWGWQAAFHPDDLPRLMEKWGKMLVSGESDEIEARLRRHDGVYRWFLIRAQAFRDEAGNIIRWYGTSTDIEDRKRVEETLRDREQSLRLILDGIAGLVAIMSATGEIEAVNRQVLDYFGKSVEDMKGWSTSNAVHPDDLPGVISALTHSVETASLYDFDHRLRRADGVYRWFHARGVPLRDPEGHVLRWYVLLTDMDDRKRAEEELRTAHLELARVMRVMTMGPLTASIAHEVNQPISGIITNASTCLRMLDANPPNLEGARETARRTIRDGHRASDVVTRLRTLYSKKVPAVEPMDLNEATREVTALSATEIQKNGVTLRQEFAADLPPALGDRVQLQQVILNLLRNAADAMREVHDRPRELVVRTERDEGEQIRLSVKDSGVGLTPQAADKIFEPFYTTKNDGMGIGLSISRSIIEAHQGRLWVTRNDGPGTTFTFTLPCGAGSAAGAQH